MRCVLEIQTAVAEKNADVPEDCRIAFRTGVNVGDIIIDGDDIFGDGVNVAARLQEIALPGGLCISGRKGSYSCGSASMSARSLCRART